MVSMDTTEGIRKLVSGAINNDSATDREAAEAQYGQVWTTSELTKEFFVKGFMAPYVVVVRKSDNQRGTMMFQHRPRFYFNFQVTEEGGA
tara:strand:- start:76 stop:345 length:270 start_codon:yes stop_codon:yes gene_type:complete